MQPPKPPLPLSAAWSGLPQQIVVTFDQPLQPGLVVHGNWTARHAAKMYAPAAPAVVVGAVVTVPMILNFADLGPDVVNYTAAVPDIIGLASGVPATAFAAFPIT